MKTNSIILILSLTTIIYAPFKEKGFSTIIEFQEYLRNGSEKTICVIYKTETKSCTFLHGLNKKQVEEYFYQFPHCAFIKYFSSRCNLLVVSHTKNMPLQEIITKATMIGNS
ncbi:MAG: hypothetical protein EBU90_10970 [Proteobacteria bacterium]|nr:hypothetical protein [Pseudomonadota bacterium]NBP14709.1 hypothetical protein [bacterium]